MENQLQLVDDQRGAALPVAQPQQQVAINPYDGMLIEAVRGGNIDIIERLMALKERDDANTARKAFTAAKAAFKGEAIIVTKDKFNTQYKSNYSSLGNLVNTVSPFLSKHGLSADWNIEQTGAAITVTCILSHALGHSESVSFTVPPDSAGAKNPIQAIKSSVTYAKAVTYESVCGMASSDANHDDDGNGAADKPEPTRALPVMSAAKFSKAIESVRSGSYTPGEIEKYYVLTSDQKLALLCALNPSKDTQ